MNHGKKIHGIGELSRIDQLWIRPWIPHKNKSRGEESWRCVGRRFNLLRVKDNLKIGVREESGD